MGAPFAPKTANCCVCKFSVHVLDLAGHDRLSAKLKFKYLAGIQVSCPALSVKAGSLEFHTGGSALGRHAKASKMKL